MELVYRKYRVVTEPMVPPEPETIRRASHWLMQDKRAALAWGYMRGGCVDLYLRLNAGATTQEAAEQLGHFLATVKNWLACEPVKGTGTRPGPGKLTYWLYAIGADGKELLHGSKLPDEAVPVWHRESGRCAEPPPKPNPILAQPEEEEESSES